MCAEGGSGEELPEFERIVPVESCKECRRDGPRGAEDALPSFPAVGSPRARQVGERPAGAIAALCSRPAGSQPRFPFRGDSWGRSRVCSRCACRKGLGAGAGSISGCRAPLPLPMAPGGTSGSWQLCWHAGVLLLLRVLAGVHCGTFRSG